MAAISKHCPVVADSRLYADFSLTCSEASTDVASNSSTISWSVSAAQVPNTTANFYGHNRTNAATVKVYINGSCVLTKTLGLIYMTSTNKWTQSGTTKVTHNDDGNKAITVTLEIDRGAGNYTNDPWTYSSASGSASMNLTFIARASTVSCPSLTMGTASSITVKRASTSFSHVLRYSFGSTSGQIVSSTTNTSVSWTPPLSLAGQIPKATSGTITIYCDTYYSGSKIGTKSVQAKIYVPSSVKPTLSGLTAAVVNPDSISSWGIYIQTKSKAKLTLTGAAGVYGSTITGYSIKGAGFQGSSSTLTTDYLNQSGSITFTGTVTDSRGRTSDAKTVTISVVAYSPPKISAYSSARCVAAGTESDDGTCILGNVSFSYSGCSGKNSITASTAYRKAGAASWTDAAAAFSSGKAFVFGNASISAESSYEIKYSVKDVFCTVDVVDQVSTAAVLLDFKAGGAGVAIGKISENTDSFEVNPLWSAYFHGKEIQTLISDLITQSMNQILSKVWPVGSIFISTVSTNPASLLGIGTWTAYGTGRVLAGVGSGKDGNGNTVTYAAGETGGEYKHVFTISEMPRHWHYYDKTHNAYCWAWGGTGKNKYIPAEVTSGNGTGNQLNTVYGDWYGTDWEGSSTAASLVQPYIAVYIWKRTA